MNLLGVRLNLLIGRDPIALPAPVMVLEALRDVEVTQSDRDPSGFRISIAIGRAGVEDVLDNPLVALLDVNMRVIITVIFDITPTVLMDGLVTRRDVIPGDEPGQGLLVLTGKDLSVALGRDVKQTEHPAQDETVIATKIAASYPQYGMIPKVVPPLVVDPPIPVDRTPQQNCSDWGFLKQMARRHGYVVYVEAGPVPGTNRLYWGPPGVVGLPQKALSVNLGPESNVSGVSLGQDALTTRLVQGQVKDRFTGKTVPILAIVPTRPTLGLVPETLSQAGSQKTTWIPTSGYNMAQAQAAAQAVLDLSSDDSITVSGTLDSLKYNGVLRARRPVDLRGAGFGFNGSYLVRSVTHNISAGNYTQAFSLSRNERGPKTPLVRVN